MKQYHSCTTKIHSCIINCLVGAMSKHYAVTTSYIFDYVHKRMPSVPRQTIVRHLLRLSKSGCVRRAMYDAIERQTYWQMCTKLSKQCDHVLTLNQRYAMVARQPISVCKTDFEFTNFKYHLL